MNDTSRGALETGDRHERQRFDPGGPLLAGRLAVEASAGTGKTYALSTIAARQVAEAGVPIRELLVVTFTRAAAAELRDRLRGRLLDFTASLESDAEPTDEVLAALRGTDRELRLERLRAAVSEFDTATITTIHGFAQQVMGTLGSNPTSDPDAVLVDDTRELVTQAAADVLTAAVLEDDEVARAGLKVAQVRDGAMLLLDNPGSLFVPDLAELAAAGGHDGSTDDPQAGVNHSAALLRELVDEVVERVRSHRRTIGTLSFDDLLVRLRDVLVDPEAGRNARRALQARYSVALIDEFQDTDPIQWSVFETLFGSGEAPARGADQTTLPDRTMVMVGDPKQAIYAFRGANVHTYLQAVRHPDTRLRDLGTNWRSDPLLLQATATLLRGTTFGAADIGFHDVEPAPRNANGRIADSAGDPLPSLSIRTATGDAVSRQANSKRHAIVASGRNAALVDLALHVRDLLETAWIPLESDEHGDDEIPAGQDREPGPAGHRRLRPDDVAVLIAKNAYGPEVRDALAVLGIPSVIARGDSVLNSEAATHWHRLLQAVARPADARRVRAACATWFFGMDAPSIASMEDEETIRHQEQMQSWGSLLVREGPAAMLGAVLEQTSVADRVLALPQGDRHMTDIDHLAELLCGAAGPSTGPAGLLETFEDLGVRAEDGDPETDIAARRVESESRAVQIMTTFVAKGLEFPVVCCPTLWDSAGTTAGNRQIWWDPEAGKRVVDLAPGVDWGSAAEKKERKRLADEELAGTNLRLLYVALTRARHHSAIWWVPSSAAWKTGLARVLFARDESGAIDAEQFLAPSVRALDDDEVSQRLALLASMSGATIDTRVVGSSAEALDTVQWSGAGGSGDRPLGVARLDRELDRAAGRWSFTSMAARRNPAGHAGHDHEGDSAGDAGPGDEPPTEEASYGGGSSAVSATSEDTTGEDATSDLPLGDIAGGATFGVLVHEVLERVDFAGAELESELAAAVSARLRFNPWPVDRAPLVEGLAAVIRTPLGEQFGGMSLSELEHRDRLDELEFDLTLGSGGSRATDAAIGRLASEHLEDSDPYREWAERFAAGRARSELAGHLTGSIDLVARVHEEGGRARFVVVDYKTNRLAPAGVTPRAEDFSPDRLPEAMAGSDYPLQALLYSVALHRYLRWRVADYSPDEHLGGIGYLFVRGMTGPGTPTVDGVPHGLASWKPPAPLIEALSDLLDGHGERP